MHLPFLERLKEKAKSRTSRWLLAIAGVTWFLVYGTTEHRLFTWINEKYDPVKVFLKGIVIAIAWAASNPVLFALVLAVLYCVAVFLWAQFSSDGGPALEIVSVWNEDQVAYRQDISGVLADSNAPIELRVYAGKVWHRQWPVKVEGHRWRAKCQFGNEESPAGSPYKIVAIAPKGRLEDKITELPPDAVKSEVVSVVRSTPALSADIPTDSTSRLQFGEHNRVGIGSGIGNEAFLIAIENVERKYLHRCHGVRVELTFTHSHSGETFKVPGWFASIRNARIIDRPVNSLTLDSEGSKPDLVDFVCEQQYQERAVSFYRAWTGI